MKIPVAVVKCSAGGCDEKEQKLRARRPDRGVRQAHGVEVKCQSQLRWEDVKGLSVVVAWWARQVSQSYGLNAYRGM